MSYTEGFWHGFLYCARLLGSVSSMPEPGQARMIDAKEIDVEVRAKAYAVLTEQQAATRSTQVFVVGRPDPMEIPDEHS
jgi:hypothetical protein